MEVVKSTGKLLEGVMMCGWGTVKHVNVKIPADLSHTGKAYWRVVDIDACIADLVEALQVAGIDMRGSCCGHGKEVGRIDLQDGRVLFINRQGTEWEKHDEYTGHVD